MNANAHQGSSTTVIPYPWGRPTDNQILRVTAQDASVFSDMRFGTMDVRNSRYKVPTPLSHVVRPNDQLLSNQNSLYNLHKIPELFKILVRNMDIASTEAVRKTNFLLRDAIDNCEVYARVRRHAKVSFDALSTIDVQTQVPIGWVYDALMMQRCYTCAEFGTYLFLPTCRRAYRTCLLRNDIEAYRLMTAPLDATTFGLSISQIWKSLVLVKPQFAFRVYGQRRTGERQICRAGGSYENILTVSVQDARKLALRIHGSQVNIDTVVRARQDPVIAAIQVEVNAWIAGGRQGKGPRRYWAEWTLAQALQDERHYDRHLPGIRYASTTTGLAMRHAIIFPSRMQAGDTLDIREGYQCLACMNALHPSHIAASNFRNNPSLMMRFGSYDALKSFLHRAFNRQEMLAHYHTCALAQRCLQEDSNNLVQMLGNPVFQNGQWFFPDTGGLVEN